MYYFLQVHHNYYELYNTPDAVQDENRPRDSKDTVLLRE